MSTLSFYSMKFPLRLPLLLAFLVGLIPIFVILINYEGSSHDVPRDNIKEKVLGTYLHKSKEALVKEADNNWREWKIPSDSSEVLTRGKHKYTQFTVEPFLPRGNTVVCLATQTTLNWLHHIVEVADNWKGRMSVAVYVPGLEFTRAKIVLWLLNQCSSLSSIEITFNFVFPLSNPADDDPKMWNDVTFTNCSDFSSVYEILQVRKEFPSYPQNLMRNVAREACNSEYVIMSDNDMIPTPGLSTSLIPVLQQQRSCNKCAFVIPVYEFQTSVATLPRNKEQLIHIVKDGKAQAFHWKFWKPNQGSHDPERWEKILDKKDVQVAYPILKYQLYYEPVYVAKRPLPLFNETFTGYGFTRNSQVLEMIFDGYRFYVLDNAFFMHRGVKPAKSNPSWRKKETGSNFQNFLIFAKNLLTNQGKTNVVKKINKGGETELKKYVQSIDNFDQQKTT